MIDFFPVIMGLPISLAFECQLMDKVPTELHDIPVHQVVTMDKVYRTYAH